MGIADCQMPICDWLSCKLDFWIWQVEIAKRQLEMNHG
jgi:hypothetical protein